ncbi:MAG: Rne/Rng family ribonuclease [Planctomycetes bacterium]|nr:Rne/Rng family ribonuclease [Planctomycetota bacterium]
MNQKIFINAEDAEEVRIALTEEDVLQGFFIERTANDSYLGNIYKGVVTNIEPSIGAAFVDFGGDRNGFLHVSDVLPVYRQNNASVEADLAPKRGQHGNIQEYLEKGQEVLVQITKDGIGKKGPTLTTYLSIPGRYLVLMPSLSRSGVSKKIEDKDERSRLKKLLAKIDPPPGMGYIIRTAGVGQDVMDIIRDLEYLLKLWNTIVKRVRAERAPAPIYQESDVVIRTIRDTFNHDVQEVWVDNEGVYRKAQEFVRSVMPDCVDRIKFYDEKHPLFHKFRLEEEVEKLFHRKVNLPSGGSIVIDQTEALVAIDVNSGKNRGEDDLEETAFKTNLEAVEEIARQLRLRDLGGVIINDFIDMQDEAHKREVERAFRAAFRRDKVRLKIARISHFGMIEMTRQRMGQSLYRNNATICPCCRGAGFIRNVDSIGLKILREVTNIFANNRAKRIQVRCNNRVADFLRRNKRDRLEHIEQTYRRAVMAVGDASLGTEEYELRRFDS